MDDYNIKMKSGLIMTTAAVYKYYYNAKIKSGIPVIMKIVYKQIIIMSKCSQKSKSTVVLLT